MGLSPKQSYFFSMRTVRPGIYRHYKNKLYKVISIARHSETLEEMVIYQALYDSKKFGKNAIWIRPKKNFLENILVNNQKVPRFVFIKND